MYLDGITFCRKCWFKNGENGYETVNNSEYNSGWNTFEDRDGLLYSGGYKVVTRNDNDVFVRLSGDQNISGIKRFNSNINIAGKTIIRSDINNGELKVFKPEVSGSTNEGFTIRTNEKFENNIPKLELLATNNYASYKYQFPKLKNENDTDYVVVNSQLADYAKASDLNDVIEEVKENEKVTAVALNSLNEITENINTITNSLNVYYSELVELRNTSSLVPGQQYRIIDYVTTTTQANTQSAGHMFDIIVTADDNSTLNEVARAGYSSVDHYFNDYNAKLEAWKIWYCLDNDKKRFIWADEENGKGVIYRMIDEWNNDCPYDFKNIKFKRNISQTNSGVYYISPSSGVETYCYTFSIYSGNSIKDNSICSNCDTFNRIYVYNNVIDRTHEVNNSVQKLNNNIFLNDTVYKNCYCNILPMECDDNSFNRGCYSNSFGERCKRNTFGERCYNNTFGKYSCDNELGDFCYHNTFGNNCMGNILGNSCYGNVFGNICSENKLSSGCNYNSFGIYCHLNEITGICAFNKFDDNCVSNILDTCSHNKFCIECNSNDLGYWCHRNTFGEHCTGNILGQDCDNNVFGNNCDNNVLKDGCDNNTFGNYCSDNQFGKSCTFNILDSNCNNNVFGNSGILFEQLKGIHYFNNVSYTMLRFQNLKTDLNYLTVYPNVSGNTTINPGMLILQIPCKNASVALSSDNKVYSFNLVDKLDKISK